MSSVVIPAMGEGRYVVESYFDDLGPSKWEILLSPLQKPAVFWGKISAPTTFYFAASLLAPLLFVPLRKPSVLSIGALTFLFIALWDNPMAKSICFQYQAGLLPVVFWGLARALTDKPMPSLLQDTRSVLCGAVVGGVTLSIFLGNAFWSKSNLSVRPVPGRLDLVKHISADIDPNATLSTSGRLAAHFVSQKGLYVLPNGLSRADYALLDLRHAWRPLPGLGWLRELRDCQRQIEAQPHLHLVAAEDGLLLYSRFGAPLDRRGMVERDRLPGGATPTQMQLGHAVQVRGVLTLPLDPDKQRRMARARVCVFSAVAAEAATDLAARCILTFGSGTSDEESYASEFQPLGQAIWPVTRWQTGTLHEDCFLMSFPEEFSRKPMEIRLEVGAF